MLQPPTESSTINASPTKEFFINMLTRDVQLTRAIIDLVDNCVDGAKRLRPGGEYHGLNVGISISPDGFDISDNCGGIPIDIASKYAFRFGRPPDAVNTPDSMGLFGVGMKRTFFKLGRMFSVESRCPTEFFTMTVDVDKWLAPSQPSPGTATEDSPDHWHFDFTTVERGLEPVAVGETGTHIRVWALHSAVSDSFSLENFKLQLLEEMSAAHSVSIQRGLSITLNTDTVKAIPQGLFVSSELVPACRLIHYTRTQLDGVAGESVNVKLYAGLAERDLPSGGWSIFCNERLIVRSDKTALTVWGSTHGLRQYHPDFAFFRGLAYFSSKDASLLPWTTTKTGIDSDSKLYRIVQREMIELTKPVLLFLVQLAKTRSYEFTEDPEEVVFRGVELVNARLLNTASDFVGPDLAIDADSPKLQRIQYSKPADEVERVKELLGARSFKEVGERTFEYYLEYEGNQ